MLRRGCSKRLADHDHRLRELGVALVVTALKGGPGTVIHETVARFHFSSVWRIDRFALLSRAEGGFNFSRSGVAYSCLCKIWRQAAHN